MASLLALTLSACASTNDTAGKPEATHTVTASPSASAGGTVAAGKSVTGNVEEDDGAVSYEISAEKVDMGTESQAAQLVRDKAEAKGKVLAVAHVRFTHKSGPTVGSSSDVNDGTTIWADGQRGALLIGAPNNAAGCEDIYDIENWKVGESHTVCTSYLIPSATKNVQVHWSQEHGTPYIWTFPNS